MFFYLVPIRFEKKQQTEPLCDIMSVDVTNCLRSLRHKSQTADHVTCHHVTLNPYIVKAR